MFGERHTPTAVGIDRRSAQFISVSARINAPTTFKTASGPPRTRYQGPRRRNDPSRPTSSAEIAYSSVREWDQNERCRGDWQRRQEGEVDSPRADHA